MVCTSTVRATFHTGGVSRKQSFSVCHPSGAVHGNPEGPAASTARGAAAKDTLQSTSSLTVLGCPAELAAEAVVLRQAAAECHNERDGQMAAVDHLSRCALEALVRLYVPRLRLSGGMRRWIHTVLHTEHERYRSPGVQLGTHSLSHSTHHGGIGQEGRASGGHVERPRHLMQGIGGVSSLRHDHNEFKWSLHGGLNHEDIR